MTNDQRRGPSRDRDQDWNDRSRTREDRWDDEGRSARSGYEQRSAYEQDRGDFDYDRELDERGFRSRESERARQESGGERDWRERERGGRGAWDREGAFGRESGWGNESRPWGNEGRYGRESYGSQSGMGRQREGFGGRDASWRYAGSAYEPYYRAGRGRSEERGGYEREDWRSQGSSYGGGSNYGGGSSLGYGSNYGFGSGAGTYGGSQQQRQGWRGSQSSREMGGRTGQHAGKGPKDFRRSDERLREEISEHLMADPDIDASELTVNVKDGEVTLEGSVPDRQTKRDAEDCVENVLGVRQVNNRLRVSESSSRGSGTNLNRGYEMSGSQRGQQSGQSGQSGPTGPSGQGGQSGQQSSHQASNRITGKGDNV
jgi:osmotically-inducible protein OsmY